MRFAALRPTPAEAPRLLPVTVTTAGIPASGDPFEAPYAQRPAGSPDTLVFYQFDHLGNTRLAYRSLGGTRQLLHTADYYPFGKPLRTWSYSASQALRHQSTGHVERSEIPHQGIGKRDRESGLDYRLARFYDSDVGRFLSVDPLADQREWLSPYNFVQNNPILRVDPNGSLDGDYYNLNSNGELEYAGNDGIDDDKVYVQNDYGNKNFKGVSYYEVLGGKEAFKGDYGEGHTKVDNMALSRLDGYILNANGRRASKDLDYAQNPKSVGVGSDLYWVFDESVRGDLDFKFFIAGKDPKTGGKPTTQTLYLAGEYYMNVNTFGNYVWGAYGAALELPKIIFTGLAQAGSLRQGRFDEPHENKAIGLGYDFLKTKMSFQGGNKYKYSYIK